MQYLDDLQLTSPNATSTSFNCIAEQDVPAVCLQPCFTHSVHDMNAAEGSGARGKPKAKPKAKGRGAKKK